MLPWSVKGTDSFDACGDVVTDGFCGSFNPGCRVPASSIARSNFPDGDSNYDNSKHKEEESTNESGMGTTEIVFISVGSSIILVFLLGLITFYLILPW